jgi:hypothetical protein
MTDTQLLYDRKATLVVVGGEKGLDLSQLHFTFNVNSSNEESPNTAEIRVFNLSMQTINKIIGKEGGVEYSRVVLNAGYQNAAFGVIFDGTIKQFRQGRLNATDTYLDILAASNDEEYNFGVVSATIQNATPSKIVKEVGKQMGLGVGYIPPNTGGILPRGKVLWGMGRAMIRSVAATQQWSWSLQDGKIQMVPLDSYLPGEAVVLNRDTGMIGIPEQTDQGIKVRSLLNPKLNIAGRLQINNADINKTLAQNSQALRNESGAEIGQLPYNQRAGLQLLANVSNDGLYFIYVVEHQGDTRGGPWYSDIVCLAIDASSKTVEPYG